MRSTFLYHFDLNRTILMSDAIGGRNMENIVNYLLSECIMGNVQSGSNGQWSCPLSAVPLNAAISHKKNKDEDTSPSTSYKQYVDTLYPYSSITSSMNVEEKNTIKVENKYVYILQTK